MSKKLAKISRPAVNNVVLRQRLFKVLDKARERPAVWLSAPAGSGKTTLISSYLESRHINHIWYQIDTFDSDLGTFIQNFGEAARSAIKERKRLPVLLPIHHGSEEVFLKNYFSKLLERFKTPGVVVFDNYQILEDVHILNDCLSEFLKDRCEDICFIFVSRNDAPEKFSLLQSRQLLTYLSGPIIDFNKDEMSNVIFNIRPDILSDAAYSARLQEQSKGWVGGLILLLDDFSRDIDSLEIESNSSDKKHIFDYFASEVFNKADVNVQEFLLKTSFLTRMTIGAAKDISGSKQARLFVKRLLRNNYFIYRHGVIKPEYEYHPLFQDFLRERALELYGDDEIVVLKNTAALLLNEMGYTDEAIALYMQSESWDNACKLICLKAKNMIEQGNSVQLGRWINDFPEKTMKSSAQINYWLGMALLHYDSRKSRNAFEQAYVLYVSTGDVEGQYLAWSGVVDTYSFAFDSFCGTDEWVEKFEELQSRHPKIPGFETRARVAFSLGSLLHWINPTHALYKKNLKTIEMLHRLVPNKTVKIVSAMQLILYYGQTGEVAKVKQFCLSVKRYHTNIGGMSFLDAFLEAMLIMGDWLSADFALSKEDVDNINIRVREEGLEFFSGAVLAQALYHAEILGDTERVEKLLVAYKKDINADKVLDIGHHQIHESIYHIMKGDIKKALECAEYAVVCSTQACTFYPDWFHRLVRAYLYIENAQHVKASEEIDDIFKIQEQLHSHTGKAICLMLYAWMAYKNHNFMMMIENISQAFLICENKNIRSYAFWPHKMIRALCAKSLKEGVHVKYATELIRIYDYQPAPDSGFDDTWPWPIKIYTMGRFDIIDYGVRLNLGRKTPKRCLELLKVIISSGKHNAASSDHVVEAMWPELDGEAGYNALNTLLYRLRKLLGISLVIQHDGYLSLDRDRCWVDVWYIEERLDELHTIDDLEHEAQYIQLQSITKLYRGSFLDNENAGGWMLSMRERMRFKMLNVIRLVGEKLHSESEYEKALYLFHSGLELDDLSEHLYQGIMSCCLKLGRYSEGVIAYQRCRDIFSKVLQTVPSKATEELRAALQQA